LATGTPWGTMMRSASDVGLTVPIVGGNGNALISQLNQYQSYLPKDLYFAGPPAIAEGSIGAGPIRDAQSVFFAALKSVNAKPDLLLTQAWDPTMLLIDALRHLGTNATTAASARLGALRSRAGPASPGSTTSKTAANAASARAR
jgi:hypothetical protein